MTGCAGIGPAVSTAQNDGPISVEPSQAAGYDYLVVIRDGGNLGFDPNDQQARDLAALAKLRDQCDDPKVVGETVVKSDAFGQGSQPHRYEVKVRC